MPHAYEYYNCLWLTTNYRILHFPMISVIGSDNLLACMCVCVCVCVRACARVCACHTLGMKSHVRFSYATLPANQVFNAARLYIMSHALYGKQQDEQ